MNAEHEAEFKRILDSSKRAAGWILEQPLRDLIAKIEEAAFDRGQLSGASPHDGSWPAEVNT